MTFSRAAVLLAAASTSVFAADPPGAAPAQPPAPIAQTQPPSLALGRLFFSPDERAAIDESRLRPAVVAAPEAKPLPPAPEYVTLNGVVRRSDGSTSVWLNNRLVEGRRTAEGLEVSNSRRAPGPANVTVRVPQAGRSIDLRVGQRLDVTSGKVQERYQVAPQNAAPAELQRSDAEIQSTPRSALRRPSREREVRELLRDLESPPAELPQPPAEAKG